MTRPTTHHIHQTDASGNASVLAFAGERYAWRHYRANVYRIGWKVSVPIPNTADCARCDNIDENTEVRG